jgi:hypothetical protein
MDDIDFTPAREFRFHVPAWPLRVLGFLAELLFPEGRASASARASLEEGQAFVEVSFEGDSAPSKPDFDN